MDGDGARVRGAPPDPYAVLNLDPARADDEAVRRAYRAGSRALHPDRQPPERREAARRAFVELKRARDVLADPVARFAHDERGTRGTELVRFLERRRAAAAATDDDGADDDRETLWTLGALLARGDRAAARRELTGRARRAACLRESGAAPSVAATTTTATECDAEFRCDAADGLGALRADQVVASLTVDLAPTLGPASSSSSVGGVVRPRSVRVGASGTVRDGSARAGGRATIEFEPAPGSDVKLDCDAGSEAVSVSTTRTTTTGTVFTVGATTPWTRRTEDSDGGPTKQRQKRPLSLNFTTHRLLFGRTVHGLFTVGAGTDRTFHYSRLSLTTLRPDRPRCALTLGLGLDRFPLRLSITQRPKRRAAVDAKGRRSDDAAAADATDDDRRDDDDDPSSLDDLVARRTAVPRARRLTLKLGLGGAWEVGGSVERVLPPLARSTAGLRWHHAGEMVVTLGLRTTTGASLTVPVTVARSTAATTATTAIASLVRWTAWTWAVDAVVADALADALRERLSSLENAPTTTTTTTTTTRRGGVASSGATALIARRAAASRRRERDKTNGLVVTRATYGRDTDVTDRLQFWVSSTTSTLTLPASVPKERALFLEEDEVPRRPGTTTSRRPWRPWRSTPTTAPPPPPIELTVRYEHGGYAYEITVGEADALVLPPTSNNGRDDRRATLLGRSDVVS